MMAVLQNAWRRVVQFGFRLLYNELAFIYDWVSRIVSLGQWKCWQRAVFRFIGEERSQSILELAHGTGDLQLDLYERGFQDVIGADLSPAMGSIASRKLHAAGITPRLVRCRAQALPFASRRFDTLLCTFPTPFIFEAETLREVQRVLRDGGQMVIVLNGMFATGGLHVRLLEWLYRITGQRGQGRQAVEPSSGELPLPQYQHLLDHMAGFGFTVRLERVPCPRSEAHVIVAVVNREQGEI